MAGVVVEVLVSPGDEVAAGDELVILESMKLEVPVTAPADGVVASLEVAAEAQVGEGDLLLSLEP